MKENEKPFAMLVSSVTHVHDGAQIRTFIPRAKEIRKWLNLCGMLETVTAGSFVLAIFACVLNDVCCKHGTKT